MPRGEERLRANDGAMNLVGGRVLARRRELGITRDQLSGRIGEVTQGGWAPSLHSLLKIERGTRIVTDTEAAALAQALGCAVSWLLLGDTEGTRVGSA